MSTRLDSPWPARDDQLRALWAAGESTARIAERMGLTKNSVVGRAHRLGLAARPNPICRAAGGAPAVRRPAPRLHRTAVLRPTPPPPMPAVRLSPTRRCAWPLWPNGADRAHPAYGCYCDAPSRSDSSYCPQHHARARVRSAEAG